MRVRRILTVAAGSIYSTDYAPATCDVVLVMDPRRTCPRCGRWPCGVSARSTKGARRALERIRACPCHQTGA